MKTFSINTLGCKVNQYESQQLRELLEQFGLKQVKMPEKKPDLVAINTCCVTLSASAKSRQCIRKARKLNPDAMIIVCGCLPKAQTDELNNLDSNTHVIGHQQSITATLKQILNGKTADSNHQNLQQDTNTVIKAENNSKIKYKFAIQPELPLLTSFKGQSRAFLKVQDGCDGYCSYCVIPKSRPFVQSKPTKAVLQEAQALADAGHKEIVITGIFLGAYGLKTAIRRNWGGQQNNKLAELLEKLVKIPNLTRIRLSSLEPADVTQRLLDTFCEYHKIMPHIHLSLQSGSNTILKKMCRQYRVEECREKIEMIKSRLDKPAITADFIVGFPGETDADFEATIDLAKETGFAKMHVFSFSQRKGTPAATMQGKVNNKVIKKRSSILRKLNIELSYKFRQQFVGKTAMVLTEDSNGQFCGRSERYFMVYFEKPELICKKNTLIKVKLIGNNEKGAIGKI